jgi:hypothetical protein
VVVVGVGWRLGRNGYRGRNANQSLTPRVGLRAARRNPERCGVLCVLSN